MSDIFDYCALYLLSLLLAILKITLVISWPWWVIWTPTVIGALLTLMGMIVGDR